LASIARAYDEFTGRGARIAAISVDPPAANAGMVEKLALPFPVLSDPDGEQAIKPYGVWHEGRNIAKPAIVMLAADSREVFRYVGADFMDRPGDEEIFAALDALALPSLPASSAVIEHLAPSPSPRALPLDVLAPYMRGVQMAMRGMAERMRDPADRAEVSRTAAMAEQFQKAQAATRRVVGSG
jgi:AhpC/TSA family